MVIVQLISSVKKGGAERFVIDLCNALSTLNDKNKIFLVSLFDDDKNNTLLHDLSSNVSFISLGKSSGFDLKTLAKVTRLLYKLKPAVIHTHMGTFEYVSLYLKFNKRVRHVHTIHTIPSKEIPASFFRSYRRYFYKRSSIPVCISHIAKKDMEKYYNIDNCKVVYNGRPEQNTTSEVDKLSKEWRKDNGLLFVHIGRIMVEKNQELLVNSFKLFNKVQGGKHTLLIIGDNRDINIVEKLNNIIEKEDSIFLLGGKNNVFDYLSIADGFCLTSTYEGMPISLIEAFSAKCIPICTAVGGIKEMIREGYNGFLSGIEINEYKNSLLEFVNCSNKAYLEENCYSEFINKYEIKSTANNYYQIYQNG